MDRLKADTRFSAIVQQSALLGDCILSVTHVLISNGKKAEGKAQKSECGWATAAGSGYILRQR